MTQPTDKNTEPETHFARIADALRQQIKSGALCAGAALPSERSVADIHNVSRMTARRALEALEAEGLAYSEGRRGRFVSPGRVSYDVSQMVSFVADAQAKGLDLDITVIDAETLPADPRIARALALGDDAPVHKYIRLFRVNGHPTFLETEYVSAALYPDLLGHDLRQSTTALLDQHFGATARTGEITSRMRAMSHAEAEHLGQSPNRAGLELEQIIQNADGQPFCFGRQIWRGELAEFSACAIVETRPSGTKPTIQKP
jgi:GntR family transcriptional regulator